MIFFPFFAMVTHAEISVPAVSGFFNSREPSRGNPHLCGKKEKTVPYEENHVPWDLICRGAVRLGGLPRDQISSDVN